MLYYKYVAPHFCYLVSVLKFSVLLFINMPIKSKNHVKKKDNEIFYKAHFRKVVVPTYHHFLEFI